jgi:hypothetical protein
MSGETQVNKQGSPPEGFFICGDYAGKVYRPTKTDLFMQSCNAKMERLYYISKPQNRNHIDLKQSLRTSIRGAG